MAHKNVVKRKILAKDWDEVAQFIQIEYERRKSDKYRIKHESRWKELDRQVYMESMARLKADPDSQGDGRSALELGELSRASEVLSADVNRLAFPQNRNWFDAHVNMNIDEELDKINNEEEVDQKRQVRKDGGIRALMVEQHLMFGLKARQGLSIKEALHHGGYVVEVKMETMQGIQDGEKVKNTSAPVWEPHSMWNCYPDNSRNTTNMFYTGSMIIKSTMKYVEVKKWKGDGYRPAVIKKLNLEDNQEVKLKIYYGTVTISRKKDGDIILPNCKIITANKKVIFYKVNELAHPQIIYNGYERLDVRDPYFTSPLVKHSPTQKIATTLANQLVDSIEGKVMPPMLYDGNDPDLTRNGGVSTVPGTQTPTKSLANHKIVDVGDPVAAQAGVVFFMGELQKGTGVDSVRSGMTSGAEQTATEVERTRQGGQIRTVDFVDKHESHGLRPFLYMQHELNKLHLDDYSFYNPEMDAPDFERLSKNQLPINIHFAVVGSKGLMEEQERQTATLQVINFLMSTKPDIVNMEEVSKSMLQDAGNKAPEKMLNITDKDEQFTQQLNELKQQAEQEIQQIQEQAGQKIAELQEQVDTDKLLKEKHAIVIESKGLDTQKVEIEKERLENVVSELRQQLELRKSVDDAADDLDENINKEVNERVDEKLSKTKEKESDAS